MTNGNGYVNQNIEEETDMTMTMMQQTEGTAFTSEVRSQLDSRPEGWEVQTKPGRGGAVLSYIPVSVGIEKANHIWGPENWGSQTLRLERISTGTRVDRNTGEVVERQSYIATVRVAVRGALPKEGTGLCEVAADTPDGHDTAAKGAESDALRRALRQFGTAFGNGLYHAHLTPMNGTANGTSAPARQTRARLAPDSAVRRPLGTAPGRTPSPPRQSPRSPRSRRSGS